MEQKWTLYRVQLRSLMSFSYPSRERALLGAYDLDGSWREFALYIEAPDGERIEQPEINQWCQNRFEQLITQTHATSQVAACLIKGHQLVREAP
jgi:hypothetical protein